jgi:hypothetical protein
MKIVDWLSTKRISNRRKKITLETSQGRKKEWMLGDQDYSKACLYKSALQTTKYAVTITY